MKKWKSSKITPDSKKKLRKCPCITPKSRTEQSVRRLEDLKVGEKVLTSDKAYRYVIKNLMSCHTNGPN